jgi:O-methyltransferase involved in polyketide biosynthesis
LEISAVRLERVAKSNTAWTFGLEPATLKDYLKPFHLDLVADIGNADYQEKYLRPMQRELAVFEGERVAQAVVIR